MRIAFTSLMNGTPWGGSELLWANAAAYALKQNHDVATLTTRWQPTPTTIQELAKQGATTLFRSQQTHPSLPIRALRRASTLFSKPTPWDWRSLDRWQPEFLCISQGSSYEAADDSGLLRYLKQSQLPYGVICQHNHEVPRLCSPRRAAAMIRLYSHAEWVAFVAERNHRQAERDIAERIPQGRVVRNPVNLTDTSMVPWPKSNSPTRLAVVARLEVEFKGQDILLETLARNEWRGRDWVLRLYGNGPDHDYLQRLVRHYRFAAGRVEFVGHVNEIRQVWAENHLLVMPSRSEGTPLSLTEAMLCGRPSVVTNVGGIAEWVQEPDNGFLAEAASVDSLSNALKRAWQRRNDWPSIGQRAHDTAMSQIDPEPGNTILNMIEQQ